MAAARSRAMADEARRILIVDDDRLTLVLLADYLEKQGYVVAKASSGEEALAVHENFDPHLIVMDICLPGISGIEAAQRICTLCDTPVIFLSAYEDPDYLRDSIALGGMVYLLKPLTGQQLIPPIESALARAAELRQLRSSEETLGNVLKQSREISLAIGIVMERSRVSAEEAFEMLRAEARNTQRKTIAVAKEIIAGTLQLKP
jgi:response regulator NasT